LDVIKVADRLIDLGPEGGEEGGRVIATGTPEQVAKVQDSHTGGFLAGVLPVSEAKAPKPAPRRAAPRRRAAAGAR
ncbi:MAG: hypothetical protein ACXVHX_07260, partial [Solirubrobacteraceae bacterium]